MFANTLQKLAFLSFALLGSTATTLSQSSWVRQSPFPTDRSAKSVSSIAPERAFFVGENRLMLQTKDAGANWTIHQLLDWGVDPHYAVHFTSPTTGVIVGNNEALRTTDGGNSWTPVEFFAGSWYHLDFLDGNVGFAGANGACAATTDGGQSWTIRAAYPTCPVMFGMDFVSANVGLAGGVMAGTSTEGIFRTADGGRTWNLVAQGAANDVVWMSSTRAVADYGTTIRESVDGGQSWFTVYMGLTSGLVSMTRAGTGNLVLGVSGKGDVWRSTDGGRNWTQSFDGPGALPDIWEISFADELHGWIVGPGGFYFYSSDGGVTWAQKNNGSTAQIFDLHMLDENYGLAVGHDGYMFRTRDGGQFWDVQKLEVTGQIWGRDEDLVALDIVDAQFAATAGPGGTIFKTMDGGETWINIGYPNFTDDLWIYDIDFIDHNLGYVYGINPPFDHLFLFRTRNGGASWEWVNMGYNLGGGTTAQFIDADYGWLTADNDFGWRTRDGGVTWTSFRMPQYFSGPEVSKVRFLNRNLGWVVGWDGYVGKTSDGGESWTLVNLGTISDHLFDVVPVSSTEVWLCGREHESFRGVIYRSTNAGQTWTREVVTDWFYYPYRLAVLPSGDAWFGGYAGAIFKKASNAVIVAPSSYQFFTGLHLSGTLASLASSDDVRLVAGPQYNISRTMDPIMLQVEGVSPSSQPSRIEFILESHVTSDVRTSIELWNFSLSRWEPVYSFASPMTDGTVTIDAPSPIARFVEPSTMKVRAQVRWKPDPTAARNWEARVDQAVWRIRP